MWLLILAIVLLLLSSPLTAYTVSCLKEDRMLRPAVLWQYERFLVYGGFVLFLAGIIMLFIAARLEVGTCRFSHILVAGGFGVDTTCR